MRWQTAALMEIEEVEAMEATPRREVPLRLGHEETRAARVLLAEDDREMRALLASALRRDGYEVIEAHSGFNLLEEMGVLLQHGEAAPVDLIISDQRMPGFLGLEILSGLRQAGWSLPFILITGFGDRETHEEARRLGATAVFDKPFDLDELRAAVLGVFQPH